VEDDKKDKGHGRIDERTGEVIREQSQTYAHRSHESRLGLLDREHEDGDDEEERQEHLDEEALDDGCAVVERGGDGHGTGEHGRDQSGCDDAAEHLRDEETGTASPG
jgi:hypothetical protein